MSTYKSENFEKIKELTNKIASEEASEVTEKGEIYGCLEKVCKLLELPRINKKVIIDQLKTIMQKLS
jgi:hypothetical protein